MFQQIPVSGIWFRRDCRNDGRQLPPVATPPKDGGMDAGEKQSFPQILHRGISIAIVRGTSQKDCQNSSCYEGSNG